MTRRVLLGLHAAAMGRGSVSSVDLYLLRPGGRWSRAGPRVVAEQAACREVPGHCVPWRFDEHRCGGWRPPKAAILLRMTTNRARHLVCHAGLNLMRVMQALAYTRSDAH